MSIPDRLISPLNFVDGVYFVTLASESKDPLELATACSYLGQTALLQQDRASARQHLAEALALSQQVGATPLTLSIRVNLAHCAALEGDLGKAIDQIAFVCAQPAATHKVRSKTQALLEEYTPELQNEEVDLMLMS